MPAGLLGCRYKTILQIQGATAGTAVVEKISTGKMSVQVSVDYYYKSHAPLHFFQYVPLTAWVVLFDMLFDVL
jgi:hypothetical protein